MIRAVIFDIDNTLYSYDNCHKQAWNALCEYAQRSFSMDAQQFAACHDAAAEILMRRLGGACAAMHDRLLRYQVLLEENGLGLEHALPMSELYWGTLIAAAKPSPGISDCLTALKAGGCILGIGTNMTIDYQLKKLEALHLLQYFDFVVSSEETQAEKPSPRLFAHCACKAGVPAEQCLYVGDNLKNDIMGARNAGMQAVWYCTDDEAVQGHSEFARISHFDQLLKLVLV